MDNRIIILMIALVVVAGVGGYFVGLYQGAASNSLNLSNNSTGNVSTNNSSSPSTSTYKAKTVTVSTAKNKTVNNNGTAKKNETPSNTTTQ
jgi:hypothetical protein